MIDRILELAGALREAGIPVGVSEGLDAFRALGHISLDDRETLRSGLAATMIKDQVQRQAFDTLFDLYFAERGPEGDEQASDGASDEEVLDRLMQGFANGTGGERGMARLAVDRFGRVDNSPTQTRYFEYPIWRAIDLDEMLRKMLAETDEASDLERRLLADELQRRFHRFREEVAAEVRRRGVEQKGPQAVAKYAVRPLPEDLQFSTASKAEVQELRRAIRPLARKLATRLAMKRRKANRGGLDIRKTVRHSLSTGGVPFETHFRHRAPHRPELFVLCDISGSVAAFSRFSLMLVHALASQFQRVRSFVFVDTLDEVTHLFDHEDFVVAVDRMNQEARVVDFDGHSDYGNALERFFDLYGKDVTARSTLLVLGDARNNYRGPKSAILKELQTKAHRTYWLNPERAIHWDTDDSVAGEYARYVDAMVEVRNLKQLEEFVVRSL